MECRDLMQSSEESVFFWVGGDGVWNMVVVASGWRLQAARKEGRKEGKKEGRNEAML